MKLCSGDGRRRGASAVEFAVAAGVTFLLVFGLLVGSLGVFRYQETAHLAREGARYASTHGGRYSLDGVPAATGVSAISSSKDLKDYLTSRVGILDPESLEVSVSWSSPADVNPRNLPSYVVFSGSSSPGMNVATNYVTVTVTSEWLPELYLVGPITLTSTSTMAMSY